MRVIMWESTLTEIDSLILQIQVFTGHFEGGTTEKSQRDKENLDFRFLTAVRNDIR